MSEFIGLVIVSISLLGLIYSIGSLFTTNRSSPNLNSISNLEAYHKGLLAASKQPMLESEK